MIRKILNGTEKEMDMKTTKYESQMKTMEGNMSIGI